MDTGSEYFPDSFTNELDDAVRKSWSEPQNSNDSPLLRESPMGTPTNRSYIASSSGSNLSSNRYGSPTSNFTRTSGDASIEPYPAERHYSLTENTEESISDILTDLTLGGPEYEGDVSQISRPLPPRRSSIQEVQRVRQLLNPRSSFSGASSLEPQIPSFPEFCWATILPNDQPELTIPIMILHKSLLAVNSKYKLYVLHSNDTDVSRLQNSGIETLNYSEYLSTEVLEAIHPNSKLILFIALVKIFDIVCYLSPTSMVLENVDELLDSKEVSDEIDNDTCVLLSNGLPDRQGNDDNIQVLILRPSQEVAMCINEFFTVYGIDEDDRRGKIAAMKDCDVLKTLFDETWGYISSDEYSKMSTAAISKSDTHSKIIDFKEIEPWNYKLSDIVHSGNSTANQQLNIWRHFLNSIERAESM